MSMMPVLYMTSFLYYTDQVSTAMVLLTLCLHLSGQDWLASFSGVGKCSHVWRIDVTTARAVPGVEFPPRVLTCAAETCPCTCPDSTSGTWDVSSTCTICQAV